MDRYADLRTSTTGTFHGSALPFFNQCTPATGRATQTNGFELLRSELARPSEALLLQGFFNETSIQVHQKITGFAATLSN